MRRMLGAAAVVAVVLGSFGVAGSADASGTKVDAYQGSDYGYADLGYNCSTANSSHRCFQHYEYVAVADREKDGHGAAIYWKDSNGETRHIVDVSGSNDGDAAAYSLHKYQTGVWVVWIQVCEGEAPAYNQSCGTRVNTPGFWVEAA